MFIRINKYSSLWLNAWLFKCLLFDTFALHFILISTIIVYLVNEQFNAKEQQPNNFVWNIFYLYPSDKNAFIIQDEIVFNNKGIKGSSGIESTRKVNDDERSETKVKSTNIQ